MMDFLQGLLYPLTHLEHLAFWVALGGLAATRPQGIALPMTLALIAIAGTGLPFLNLGLPGLPLVITFSLISLGLFLSSNPSVQDTVLTSIGAVCALCHGNLQASLLVDHSGRAAIVSLLGLLITQFTISVCMYQLSQLVMWYQAERSILWFRWLGFLVIGIGLTTITLP